MTMQAIDVVEAMSEYLSVAPWVHVYIDGNGYIPVSACSADVRGDMLRMTRSDDQTLWTIPMTRIIGIHLATPP